MDLKMEIFVFLAYAIGFFSIFFLWKVFVGPGRIVGKLLFNSLAGAGVIAVLNIVGSNIGVAIPINFATSFLIGGLGIPGAIMLLVIF